MSGERKSDADAIVAHLESLKMQDWIGKARAWWPDFLFHFTDARNAARILNTGRMYSRAELLRRSEMAVDSARGALIICGVRMPAVRPPWTCSMGE